MYPPTRKTTSIGEDGGGERTPAERAESVFRTNLEAFGSRASQLCALLRLGRITADACFVALTQLWIQLARSHRSLEDRPGGDEREAPPH